MRFPGLSDHSATKSVGIALTLASGQAFLVGQRLAAINGA